MYYSEIETLIINFRAALTNRDNVIIAAMWQNNPILINYFNGKPVTVNIINSETGQEEEKIIQILFEGLIANFKIALTSQNIALVSAMQKHNKTLIDCFSGKPVTVTVINPETNQEE